MLFDDAPFVDRFALAAKAGFSAVECHFPYAFAKEELAAALSSNGMQQTLFNLPAGNWENGERGIAALPGREGEFRAGISVAIEYAQVLQCPMVNCLSGIVSSDDKRARSTFIENLGFAAQLLKQAGIKLLIEPINNFDIPGFWLNSMGRAHSVISEVGASNLYIQFDFYHQQRIGGELIGTFMRHRPLIAHAQIADNPGRHEPGTGEINYSAIFNMLDRVGYDGWVGCEYRPLADTRAGLDWMSAYLGQR